MTAREEQATIAATALYYGATFSEAAAEAGIRKETLVAWRKEPWFEAIYEGLQDSELDVLAAKARGVIDRKLTEGDAQTARWVLERRDRKFASKTTVEHTGRVDHQHSLDAEQVAALTDAQLDRLLAVEDDAIIDAVFEEVRPLALVGSE